jgi:hypothetical protein
MLEGVLGMLAFLGTALGLLGGILLIGLALLARRWRRAGKIGLILLGWIAVYAVVLLGVSLTSQVRHIQLGSERCFDEMCYSVQAVSVVHTLGAIPHQVAAQGNYTLITIRLRSAAKRTAQRPSQPNLFLIDADGWSYSQMLSSGTEMNLPPGQPITASQVWEQPVQPGESLLRTVAFDLPIGVRQAGLVLTEGIGPLSVIIIGDENSFLHARTVFALVP